MNDRCMQFSTCIYMCEVNLDVLILLWYNLRVASDCCLCDSDTDSVFAVCVTDRPCCQLLG